jgi:hypothetical protein
MNNMEHSSNNHNGYPMPNPQLMKHAPPPQIFGAYGSEGSPVLAGLDLGGSMFGDVGTLLDDSNEAKRRRIARVCSPLRR